MSEPFDYDELAAAGDDARKRKREDAMRDTTPVAQEPEIVTTAREFVATYDHENATLPRSLRPGKTTEYEFAQAVIRFYEISERAMDSEMDKLLAMPDERIQAALRLEGRDPKDAATIVKQAGEIATLQHGLAKALGNHSSNLSESRPSSPTTYAEIQQRIGELHGEIHRLAAKITGDPSQGVTMRATRSPYDCGPNPTKDYPGE